MNEDAAGLHGLGMHASNDPPELNVPADPEMPEGHLEALSAMFARAMALTDPFVPAVPEKRITVCLQIIDPETQEEELVFTITGAAHTALEAVTAALRAHTGGE